MSSGGGGQVVSELTYYSDNPSQNPAEVYNFSEKWLLKKNKNYQKEAGVGPFFIKRPILNVFVILTWKEINIFL